MCVDCLYNIYKPEALRLDPNLHTRITSYEAQSVNALQLAAHDPATLYTQTHTYVCVFVCVCVCVCVYVYMLACMHAHPHPPTHTHPQQRDGDSEGAANGST